MAISAESHRRQRHLLGCVGQLPVAFAPQRWLSCSASQGRNLSMLSDREPSWVPCELLLFPCSIEHKPLAGLLQAVLARFLLLMLRKTGSMFGKRNLSMLLEWGRFLGSLGLVSFPL